MYLYINKLFTILFNFIIKYFLILFCSLSFSNFNTTNFFMIKENDVTVCNNNASQGLIPLYQGLVPSDWPQWYYKNPMWFSHTEIQVHKTLLVSINSNSSITNSVLNLKSRDEKLKQLKHDFLHWKFRKQIIRCLNLKMKVNSNPSFGVAGVPLVASAQPLPDLPKFTTEDGIFTGIPPPTTPTPPPLRDLEVSIIESYASFTYLKISWKAIFDITKVKLRHTDRDDSVTTIELPVNLTGEYTTNLYKDTDDRRGFRYKLGGLYKRRRYYLQTWAYGQKPQTELYVTLSYLTDEKDADDRLYNLNGIFMVLGISTIIMLMVLICVGYEKLLHDKKNDCIDTLMCRKKKKKISERLPNGSISPEPLSVGRRSQVAPMDINSNAGSSTGVVRF